MLIRKVRVPNSIRVSVLFFLCTLALTATTQAPAWEHLKISDTEGGFEGALDDGDWFSITPRPLGDLDGDGRLELVVGAPGDDDGGSDRGAVWVLFNLDPAGVDDTGVANLPTRRSHLVATVPNPFSPKTTIHYNLAQSGGVSLQIYDVTGRQVRSFDLTERPAGANSIEWDGTDDQGRMMANGIYMVRLVTPESQDVMQVTLVR